MEDERVISTTANISKTTAEFLLKMLYCGISKSYGMYKESKLETRVFTGETEWNKFMESIDPIQIKDFKNNEVNLDRFKEELEKYGMGFSFYKHADGKNVSLAYSINHSSIVEKAINETLEKIVRDDNFIDKVKKTSKDNTLEEKLNYYTQQAKTTDNFKEEIKEKHKEKSL